MTSDGNQQSRADDSARESPAPHDAESVSKSLQLLDDAATEQGRDWKLIDALLVTLAAFPAGSRVDVLAPHDPRDPTRRLRPEFRARMDAVADSLSDDEAALFLGVGTRQWTPDEVERFMTETEPTLKMRDEPITPWPWLILGLDSTSAPALIRKAAENDE